MFFSTSQFLNVIFFLFTHFNIYDSFKKQKSFRWRTSFQMCFQLSLQSLNQVLQGIKITINYEYHKSDAEFYQ